MRTDRFLTLTLGGACVCALLSIGEAVAAFPIPSGNATAKEAPSSPGVIAISPARDGRLLTVEDLFKKGTYPLSVPYIWNENGECVDARKNQAAKQNQAAKSGQEAKQNQTSKQNQEAKPLVESFFSRNSSLFYSNGRDTVAIALSEEDGIVYGESVSRNEFGINGGIFPSPDSSKLAFYRKDERLVTKFPLLDIGTRTGSLLEIRYPMNGMTSEQISLGIWDKARGSTVWVRCDDFDRERYLTGVSWSPDSKYVFIQVVDRPQHEMHLNQYRSSDGSFVRTILTEADSAWVEPLDPIHFLKGSNSQFIYRTNNRDGYRSLYLCDTLGTIRRITPVDADVSYVHNDGRWVYYCSAEVSPVENHLFRVELRQKARTHKVSDVRIGPAQRLTSEKGWHRVSFSPDGKQFIDSWSSFELGAAAALRNSDGSLVRELYRTEDGLEGFAKCEVEFGTVPSADGLYENYYRLFKPRDFDPSKKYPLIVYVYGGPHSQMVQDRWLAGIRMWEMLMAQKGYVVYVQDNRGTQNRGAAFEKAINRACGQAEMADQMAGIRKLCENSWIDRSRIGVHGWSYGGFMTISLMTSYPEVFKVGVAGGPVIDWKWYEVMYGERYMDNPQTNPEGFALTSLISKAGNLKGKLLICQGAIDPTVVWEHSLSFAQKCIELDIPLDYFPYPRSEHNVFGPWRKHLYSKITNYFEDYL